MRSTNPHTTEECAQTQVGASAPRPADHPDWFLLLTVFLAGVGTLGIEMLMPRLLAPVFGTAQPVWAVVIGATLLYLAVGAWLGGVLADRWPHKRVLYWLIAWAGLASGTIPVLARPALDAARLAFLGLAAGSFLATLAVVVLLFAIPVVLLATVGPFAVRLELHRPGGSVATAGRTAGTISALSTLGALVGTFLPVFVLIPWLGTARTIYLFAALLLLVGLGGLRDWRALWMALVVALLAAWTLLAAPGVRPAGCMGCTLLAEVESRYNYIQVVRADQTDAQGAPDPHIYLLLNEGHAIHATYRPKFARTGDPRDLLTGGPWDYFAVAPYFYPQRSPQSVRSLALLGAATGTTSRQFLAIYGPHLRIDAVEIDPQILDVGRRYFALGAGSPRFPHYTVYAQDARYWLASTSRTYDVIGVDAYQQPYIPFHLTTVEFFGEVRTHLRPDGVAVVNAARSPGGDDRLVAALATTMAHVFPQVFIIDTRADRPGVASNAILVGVNRHVGDGVANFRANAATIGPPALRQVMGWALGAGRGPVRAFTPDQAHTQPFTDDWAPVERLVDAMIFAEARRLAR